MLELASLRNSLLSLPEADRAVLIQSLSEDDAAALLYDWSLWARQTQLIPAGDWFVWLILAGRGFGKTRTGAESVREWAWNLPGSRGALIAKTPGDARDVMIEGESGILATSPPWFRPVYEPSIRRLTWPNDAQASIYSAFEFDELRGPQHHWAWCDELAAWKHMQEAWDNLVMGLRLGSSPRAIVTTTPRALGLIRNLLKSKTTVVTRGSTFDNAANLAKPFLEEVTSKYAGTRLGRQELEGEVLESVEGALWTLEQLDALRVDVAPSLTRILVGVDPAGSATKTSDKTGIVADGKGDDGQLYCLADWTCSLSPDGWARRAVELHNKLDADAIVVEVNNGGDMAEAVIKAVDRRVKVIKVRASRGKHVRAEPISALYEQKKAHHVGPASEMKALEDQLCHFTTNGYMGDGSPDNADAHVWAAAELMGRGQAFIV